MQLMTRFLSRDLQEAIDEEVANFIDGELDAHARWTNLHGLLVLLGFLLGFFFGVIID